MKLYKTVYLDEIPLSHLKGTFVTENSHDHHNDIPDDLSEKLSVSYENEYYDSATQHHIAQMFDGTKQKVVEGLMRGESFLSVSKKMNISTSRAYKIKAELKKDLSFIYDEAKRKDYLQRNSDEITTLLRGVSVASKQITLSQFQQIYIDDYDREAQEKNWKQVPLQDKYYEIWENNQKSVTMAPREHLKTTSALTYITKKIFERKFPLEIDYFHLNKDIAVEKIRKLQMIIERNPILSMNAELDQAKNWKDGEIRLLDGTTIKAMGWMQGAVGKHPHIIVLDDVIDQSVVYSDEKNDKAIRKFYSEIYPMITKLTEEKKIIVIGTAQREDDLYAKLPDDFEANTFQAFTDDEEKKPLEPALFSVEELHKIKSDISKEFGEKFWLKEYMNVPFSAMGMIIKPDWIQTYVDAPKKRQVFQGWDLSVGKKLEEGDWTAGCTIGVEEWEDMLKIYVLKIFRERIAFAERLKAIVASANEWNPLKIGIEENVFQYDTVQTLKKQTNLPILGIKSVTNKVESFQVELAPHFENKKVFIRADMDDLKQELLSLPAGKHDDMADALKIAIRISALKSKQPRIRVLG